METKPQDVPWLEPGFFENQRKCPPEELARYEGQHIAWNWDGSRIVASAPDQGELYRKVQAAGLDPGSIVHEYVPPST
jgi:hypothetical protein